MRTNTGYYMSSEDNGYSHINYCGERGRREEERVAKIHQFTLLFCHNLSSTSYCITAGNNFFNLYTTNNDLNTDNRLKVIVYPLIFWRYNFIG